MYWIGRKIIPKHWKKRSYLESALMKAVYTYDRSWKQKESIVRYRNEEEKEQTYVFTLDEGVGVQKNREHTKRVQILPRLKENKKKTINYGNNQEVTICIAGVSPFLVF